MARVILAMASSSMTRCGRLLSSAMALGTALGSEPPRTSRLPPAPRVATLLESAASAGSSFMGDGAAGVGVVCAAIGAGVAEVVGADAALPAGVAALAFALDAVEALSEKFCGV